MHYIILITYTIVLATFVYISKLSMYLPLYLLGLFVIWSLESTIPYSHIIFNNIWSDISLFKIVLTFLEDFFAKSWGLKEWYKLNSPPIQLPAIIRIHFPVIHGQLVVYPGGCLRPVMSSVHEPVELLQRIQTQLPERLAHLRCTCYESTEKKICWR